MHRLSRSIIPHLAAPAATSHQTNNRFTTSAMAHLIPATIKKTITGDYNFSHAEAGDQSGRVFVITGGTNGIGLSYARTLYTRGAILWILSNQAEVAEKGLNFIRTGRSDQAPQDYQDGFGNEKDTSGEGGTKQGQVEWVKCDLEDLNEVAKVAIDLKNKLDRLDVVANIAGKGVNAFSLTKDGIDSHLAMNNLAQHLLLSHLFPKLEATDQAGRDARIINMSSEQHRGTLGGPGTFGDKFRTEDEFKKDIGPANLYNRSKLCNLLFTRAIVQRHIEPSASKILTFATHPGAVATGQQDQFKPAYGEMVGAALGAAVRPFMRRPDQGSLSVLWCSVSDSVREGVENGEYRNGEYFTDPYEKGNESNEANDQELIDNFYDKSEKILKDVVGDKMGDWKS